MAKRPPHVLQVVLQLDPGGTERLIVEMVRRLHGRFPTTVCCLDRPGSWAPEIERLGVEVVALQRPPGFHLATARALARVVRKAEATVLHCHQYSPFVYGRIACAMSNGPRLVFTEHGRHSDAPPSGKRRLVNRFLVSGVSDLYAVSHDLRRHMLAEGFPERVRVLWNGIDPGRVPDEGLRTSTRAQLGVGRDAIVVGSVGRLDTVKDFPTLIEAFAIARTDEPRLHLAIVGEGPDRPRVERAIAASALGGAVTLLGHRHDARALMAGFDIYVNSSISEGVSLTLLEAMSAGLPVVATSVGGTPEVVVHNETGLLAPARSPAALAACLTRLATDPGCAHDCGRAGRRRLLDYFTLDRMVGGYVPLYEGVAIGSASDHVDLETRS